MKLYFTKMQGCGNDYIYIDCLNNMIDSPESLSLQLSDRHFGIGGDGIVLICPSEIADAKMRMFNADGSEGKMCGNAVRCVGKYLYDKGYVKKEIILIETLSGIKTLNLNLNDGKILDITVDMGKAVLSPPCVPVSIDEKLVLNYPVTVEGELYRITCVSMGNPHCVIFCDDVSSIDLNSIGPHFENNPIFPQKVNTEFVKIIDSHNIQMRVWERGSGETLACGTGACASVVASVLNKYCPTGEEITVKLIGGDLKVKYKENNVYLTGPAKKVFEGVIDL